MTWLAQFQQGSIFAGDFEVIRPLKEGGMGAVYVVRQISTDKLRALKLMQPQLVREPTLRKRFEHEARVGARIKSNHVVEVVVAGVDEKSGLPWLAMELLEGEDLESYVGRQGALSASEARPLLEQLCHAVSAAHKASVVHRDLKPENIFLSRSQQVGNQCLVKVLDFGIAKIRTESNDNKTTAPIGTAAYMAPEQMTPAQNIAPAADIWAIGLIVFYMLTGKQYWRHANQRGGALSILREVLYEPIVPASERAEELAPTQQLPVGFDDWFARCVVHELSKRFASAEEAFGVLLQILDTAAAPRPVPSLSRSVHSVGSTPSLSRSLPPPAHQPMTPWQPTSALLPTHLFGMIGGGVLALTLLGFGTFRIWTSAHPDRPDREIPSPAPHLNGPEIAQHAQPPAQAPGGAIPSAVDHPVGVSSTPGKVPAPEAAQSPHSQLPYPARKAVSSPSATKSCREISKSWQLACQRRDEIRACRSLAEFYSKGACKKPRFAQLMWAHACELGDQEACQQL